MAHALPDSDHEQGAEPSADCSAAPKGPIAVCQASSHLKHGIVPFEISLVVCWRNGPMNSVSRPDHPWPVGVPRPFCHCCYPTGLPLPSPVWQLLRSNLSRDVRLLEQSRDPRVVAGAKQYASLSYGHLRSKSPGFSGN